MGYLPDSENPDYIIHIVNEKFTGKAGEEVICTVDKKIRLLHSRIHTAGELLAPAIYEITNHHLSPVKAIHYVGNSSVSFTGEVTENELLKLSERLEALMNQWIDHGNTVSIIQTDDMKKVEEVCGFMPDYLPKNKRARLVTVWGNIGRPCRGTHVDNIRGIGKVSITKVKKKKGVIKISYSLNSPQ